MIRLQNVALPAPVAQGLLDFQVEVDKAVSYADQVAEGKRLFGLRNKPSNSIFAGVKVALDAMCAGARRCAYCEDSMALEVEHVRPKDLYPQVVFAWANYVYACGGCNRPKGGLFAVFPAGIDDPVHVGRKRKDPVVPPVAGDPVLIDPRVEDATLLMDLDLLGTFQFAPLAPVGSRDHARAAYTIELLQLNRELLRRARREAYRDYLAHLRVYAHEHAAKASTARLDEIVDAIKTRQHPTVWREMKRHHAKVDALRALFEAVPEALGW